MLLCSGPLHTFEQRSLQLTLSVLFNLSLVILARQLVPSSVCHTSNTIQALSPATSSAFLLIPVLATDKKLGGEILCNYSGLYTFLSHITVFHIYTFPKDKNITWLDSRRRRVQPCVQQTVRNNVINVSPSESNGLSLGQYPQRYILVYLDRLCPFDCTQHAVVS